LTAALVGPTYRRMLVWDGAGCGWVLACLVWCWRPRLSRLSPLTAALLHLPDHRWAVGIGSPAVAPADASNFRIAGLARDPVSATQYCVHQALATRQCQCRCRTRWRR
jgi:hypothetical protein